jgi:hypothetical protein
VWRKADRSPAHLVSTNSEMEAAPLSKRIWSTKREGPGITWGFGPSLGMDLRGIPPCGKGGISWLGDKSDGPGALGAVAEGAKYGDVVVTRW